ncbi:MAG: hypothetical protein ACFWT2_06055 [Thermoanaerobacterium thermosaccharolyticum]
MENKRIGLLYILPLLIGLLIFTIYPFVTSLILSFTNYNIINALLF